MEKLKVLKKKRKEYIVLYGAEYDLVDCLVSKGYAKIGSKVYELVYPEKPKKKKKTKKEAKKED